MMINGQKIGGKKKKKALIRLMAFNDDINKEYESNLSCSRDDNE